MRNSIALAVAAGIASLLVSTPALAVVGTWLGPSNSTWSNSARNTGSVQMHGRLQGNGNIWIENVSNNIAAGQVAFTAQGNYGGNTTVAKGVFTFTRGDIYSPNPGNVVTIGSTGGGDATLA